MNVTDGDWKLFSYDPVTGVKAWLLDVGNGAFVIRQDIPLDDIFASTAEERAMNQGRRWGDGRVIGSIPDALAWSSGYMKAKQNGDDAWIKRFWNDRDNYKLRTFEGRV